MKHFVLFVASGLLAFGTTFAQEGSSDFADYGVGLGISPFGPAINLTHNLF